MALSERSRSALYQALSRTVEEEAVAEMLAHFPARDVEEPVTREHLDRRVAELRGELHAEIAGVRTEITAAANRTILWLVATIIAAAGLVVSVAG